MKKQTKTYQPRAKRDRCRTSSLLITPTNSKAITTNLRQSPNDDSRSLAWQCLQIESKYVWCFVLFPDPSLQAQARKGTRGVWSLKNPGQPWPLLSTLLIFFIPFPVRILVNLSCWPELLLSLSSLLRLYGCLLCKGSLSKKKLCFMA